MATSFLRVWTANFNQLADYQVQTEYQVSTHFDQIEKDTAGIRVTMSINGRLYAGLIQAIAYDYQLSAASIRMSCAVLLKP